MHSLKRSLLALFVVGACESAPPPKKVQPSTQTAAPAQPEPVIATAPKPAAAPVVVPLPTPPSSAGMEDPFARLTMAAAKRLDAGFRANHKKKYDEARDHFHAVVTASPDYTVARFEELRATMRDGDFPALVPLWRGLLARDFVAYADRLDFPKEMAPLRASPQWTQLEGIRAEEKARYLAGLDKGVFFVARSRSHAATVVDIEDDDNVPLDLDQEAYAYDPISKRIKRLTDTGGHVVAIHSDAQHHKLMIVTARALKRVGADTLFDKPQATLLSLETLERSGPLALDSGARAIAMCFSAKDEPVWTVATTPVDRALTLDATGSTMVALDEPCGPTLATTTVDPLRVQHRLPDPEGVALSGDGLQVTGVDTDKPVRASRAIKPGSLSWSPGKKRFAYNDSGERCTPAKTEDGKPATSGLYVWTAEQKKAARIVSASALYETQWLDDDHLAYETRSDSGGRVTVQDFAAGTSITLKTPAGAGLFGLPTLACADKTMAMAH